MLDIKQWCRYSLFCLICLAANESSSWGEERVEADVDLQQRVAELETQLRYMQESLQAPHAGTENRNAIAAEHFVEGAVAPPFLDGFTWVPSNPEKQFPTVALGGLFQGDWAWFQQDTVNRETVGDIQNGADFRRTRLNAHGDVANNVGYMIEFDFAFPGRPNFMDVYLDVRETRFGTFRFGQWRHSIGMDGLTSVKELTFLERALPFAFLPFRQVGLGLFDHADNERMTWAVSAFRYPTDTFGGNVGDNGGYGLASRVTLLPYLDEERGHLVHLGAAYSFDSTT